MSNFYLFCNGIKFLNYSIMKKILLLGVSLLSATTLLAQSSADDYIPLVVEGAKWECAYHINPWFATPCDIPYTIEIKGDTIINNTAYKCCVYTFEGGTCQWSNKNYPADTLTLAFIREEVENKRVYALLCNTNPNPNYSIYHACLFIKAAPEETLLYDFANINNPEQAWLYEFDNENYYPEGRNIITAGKITIDGAERNCYAIGENGKNGHIIEGIGYDGYGFFQNAGDLIGQFPVFVSGTDAIPVFKAYKGVEDVSIYAAGDAANALNGVIDIEVDNNSEPAIYYNHQGVKIANPSNGIYIKVQGNKASKILVK